jgi:glycyl-tRNA synthetase beta chain
MEQAELLVELGMEEIPASLIEASAQQFARELLQGLQDERLSGSLRGVWHTPRRIIVGIGDIPTRQSDLEESVTGPPKSVAYDAEGKPTRAAAAFAEKNGVKLGQLRTVHTPKGEYLTATRKVRGGSTHAILQRLIPQAISHIQFPKTMHWTPDNFRFSRPLRWIVALFQGRVVRFQVADVVASRYTSGHRFLGARKIPVASLESLQEQLRANGVIVDPAERLARIEGGLKREAERCGGMLLQDPALLQTVVNLNERPAVVSGSFDGRFLALPKEILVTVMREHQKYFSVVGPDGRLLPVFLAVVNLDPAQPELIRAGHERVLHARLADASFFWQTDRKTPLEERVGALKNVLFQEKLGSYYDKSLRLGRLLPQLAETAGRSGDTEALLTAARLCKCDLVTEMVKEFTDLQGIVGGLYARAEGYPEEVWRAIYDQYLPKSTTFPSPEQPTAALLALADRVDSVCGCFWAGLIPKGSRDPFAIRRQGNGIIKIILDHGFTLPLDRLVGWALEPYEARAPQLSDELIKFLEGRLRFLFEEAGFSYDAVNAALAVGFNDAVDARERVRALDAIRSEPDFLSVASNFRRIVNILEQAAFATGDPDPARMAEPAEQELWQSYLGTQPKVEQARERRDYLSALRLLASMRGAVDQFFDKVLVMAEDPAVKGNRLALLSKLAEMLRSVADISQMVVERPAEKSART